MFSKKHNKLKLVPRNEGKIKSYESCIDNRAWSHDIETRNRYLRDWMRTDMPVCVIPINSVSSALRMMSWRRRGKFVPRCHPECKSKAVLDNIYNSCHAIRECLRENDRFKKYFIEEEFMTAHWPCDRCLDALKSIKLFWKIILDKIFKIKFPKDDEIDTSLHRNLNVKTIASAWEKDLIQEAVFVKNLTPFIDDHNSFISTSFSKESKGESSQTALIKFNTDISTDTDFIIYNTKIKRKSSHSLSRKLSRCTSVRIRTVDVCCMTCDIGNEEVILYKNNLDHLQQQYNLQNNELRQLRKENISLKFELRNIQNNTVPSYTPVLLSDNCVAVPEPYESYCEKDNPDAIKDIESEMVITLKNCTNKNYKHVSMLQVLHKTNSIANNIINNNCCKKNEDPIEVLTKVHDTFDAIVKRELTKASKKKANTLHINETYLGRNNGKGNRNCSLKSSNSTISDSIFVSTTEV